MNSKINHFLVAFLIVVIIVLNACNAEMNQSITLQSSYNTTASTSTPLTSTSTVTPTLTPTDWISALLTTTPTMYPLPTLPPDCGKAKLGGIGTQTRDKSHKILVQGIAILCGQIYFPVIGRPETISVIEGMIDLDTGTINSKTADIEFHPGAGSNIWYAIFDTNNAFVEVYSLNGLTMEQVKEPTFDECQNITEHYYNAHDNAPIYACVITNLGNISRIKVEQYDPLGNETMALEISFVTWEK
jgi:hypothetical protein